MIKKYTIRSNFLILVIMIITSNLAACSVSGSLAGLTSAPEILDASPISIPAEEQSTSADTRSPVSLANTSAAEVQSGIDLEARLIELYQLANPSVVYIITATGSGSGFVYSEDGYIVTNNHVVTGQRSFEVVFADGERQRADLVSSDVDSDLAILQVEQLPEGVTPLSLAEPGDLQVGQFVIAIGNPFGEQGSMSLGIVSGLGRSLPSQRELSTGTTYSLPEVIQTDAPINPGNSGGPLLNLNGEVVGLTAAIATTGGVSSGVGFAIPVSAIARIVPSLIENGGYEYPYIGATFDGEVTLDEGEVYGLSQTAGAYVVGVSSGSPASQAGLIAADPNTGQGGDLVVAIDGQTIRDFSDLNSYLVFETSVGQTIEVTVMRDGSETTIPLTLGERP